jgi:hypothetical protein
MTSSFTDQPSPPDPPHEPGYTPTPPAPGRRGDADDHRDADLPKLGSLAQKARGKQLKQARIIFFVVGVLTIVMNIVDISMIRSNFRKAVDKEIQKKGGPGVVQVDRAQLQKAEDDTFLLGCAIDGVFMLLGVVFLIFGALVYRFPVPVTVTGLVLYLLSLGAGLVIVAVGGEPEEIGRFVSSGLLIRILIIVALAKAIQSAIAYEQERRAGEMASADNSP